MSTNAARVECNHCHQYISGETMVTNTKGLFHARCVAAASPETPAEDTLPLRVFDPVRAEAELENVTEAITLLGKRIRTHAKEPIHIIADAGFCAERYTEMCTRLHAVCQKHRLGLGGEQIDVIVCEEIETLKAEITASRSALALARQEIHDLSQFKPSGLDAAWLVPAVEVLAILDRHASPNTPKDK